jgi:hypothetical protein
MRINETKRAYASRPSKCLSPDAIAANYRAQLIETTRRSLALRKEFPGCMVRWKRAAPNRGDNPNAQLAVVFFKPPGQEPQVEVVPYRNIERLAAGVSDAEVFDELDRRTALSTGDDDP